MMRNNVTTRRGFTLIEILIVLVVISIVAAGVTLTVGHNRSWNQKVFAEEVTELLSLAQEYAILQPATLQVTISHHQIQFQQWQIDARTQKGRWVSIDESYLKPLAIPADYAVRLTVLSAVAKDEDQNNLPIVISMNGDWTPFQLWIGSVGAAPRFLIQGDRGGALSMTLLDDNESA